MKLLELWDGFLESLATRGGNLLLLAFFVVLFGSALVSLGDAGDKIQGALLTTFSAFAGALIAALRGVAPQRLNGAQAPKEE
jgi:Na+/H+-dicarboxylate symporter